MQGSRTVPGQRPFPEDRAGEEEHRLARRSPPADEDDLIPALA